jgi:transposase
LEALALASDKKGALREGCTIVFIDESGLSERPHRCRTWAPKDQTPILEFNFNWHLLSAIAGVTLWNFYFRLFPGTIKAPQVVEFLTHLLRHVRGTVVVIWDGLSAHRSRLVKDFLAAQGDRLSVGFLPGYAPELNPVEYLWGYWKWHALPNLCPRDFGELTGHARQALRRMRRRAALVAAFWKHAELL